MLETLKEGLKRGWFGIVAGLISMYVLLYLHSYNVPGIFIVIFTVIFCLGLMFIHEMIRTCYQALIALLEILEGETE